MSNIEKLVNIVTEENAKYLTKLYSKLIEYNEYLNTSGYEDGFKDIVLVLIDEIDNLMEEK